MPEFNFVMKYTKLKQKLEEIDHRPPSVGTPSAPSIQDVMTVAQDPDLIALYRRFTVSRFLHQFQAENIGVDAELRKTDVDPDVKKRYDEWIERQNDPDSEM